MFSSREFKLQLDNGHVKSFAVYSIYTCLSCMFNSVTIVFTATVAHNCDRA